MTDAELLQQFVRVRVTPVRIVVEVKIPEPKDENGKVPSHRWSLAYALPKQSLAVAVERARLMALADRRYFRECDECGEKLPASWLSADEEDGDKCRACGDG